MTDNDLFDEFETIVRQGRNFGTWDRERLRAVVIQRPYFNGPTTSCLCLVGSAAKIASRTVGVARWSCCRFFMCKMHSAVVAKV